MSLSEPKKFTLSLLGTILSALVASGSLLALSCCAGPMVFLFLGAGIASLSTLESLASYRWLFFSLTALFISLSFAQVYLRKSAENRDASCNRSIGKRKQKIFLWIVIAGVVVLLTFPYLLEKYLLVVN
jgi:mercuric ion transport protein